MIDFAKINTIFSSNERKSLWNKKIDIFWNTLSHIVLPIQALNRINILWLRKYSYSWNRELIDYGVHIDNQKYKFFISRNLAFNEKRSYCCNIRIFHSIAVGKCIWWHYHKTNHLFSVVCKIGLENISIDWIENSLMIYHCFLWNFTWSLQSIAQSTCALKKVILIAMNLC